MIEVPENNARDAAVSICAHLECTTPLSPGGPLVDAIEKIIVAYFPVRADIAESKSKQDATGLNLLRQIVGGSYNALRDFGVFACNESEHDQDCCECFWEQCEQWAATTPHHPVAESKGEATFESARAAFVKMIKEENFYSDFSKQSLRQHWNGAKNGFANELVQKRWLDFYAGWEAATTPHDPTSPVSDSPAEQE